MKGLIGLIVGVLMLGMVAEVNAIPPGFRHTPFRPNVGIVPRGVPARNFAPRNFGVHGVNAAFAFQNAYGYNLQRANAFNGYAPAAAFVPVPVNVGYAPALAAAPGGGCGAYFPQQQAAFVPANVGYVPANVGFAPGGCSAYFGY